MGTESSSPPRWKYDVFLSFRGEDTRKAFTDHLYTALDHQGIITFRDDPELHKGEAISPALFAAIKESRFALIVLSQNYASSTWCLEELVRILECMKAREAVLPIFYDVDPSDVRKQTGSFGEAFANHEERFSDDKEKVRRWRSALTEVASFSGWNSKEWYESRLITNIVEVICKRLQPTSYSYAENLVGIYSRLHRVNSLLSVGEDDVRFIGIWGMGGIGKTTMVRAVHERISREFECNFLLTDVRNSSVEKGGLLNLQKLLLSGIGANNADIFDLHVGATILQRLLCHRKVLLILDNVNHSSHLKYLAGSQEWFGSGSRVLITSRNEHLLIEHGVELRLKVEELNDDDSLQLFSQKAFKRGFPEEDFLGLSESVTSYAKGLPLALEVLGSYLYGRDISEWKSALRKLGRVCNKEIFEVLKVSFNDLDSEEQKIFLDIACFFNGQDKDQVTEVLNSCDISAIIGIKVLIERSLLNVSDGRLRMHDLLQEMGHNIVRQESNELGRCSRLWLLEDVKHVLTNNTGTEAIEGIIVDSNELGVDVDVTPKSFSMMKNLRYLKIESGNLSKELVYLPDNLRILDWTRYPLKSLPLHFNPRKLLQLSLSHSCIEHFRIGTEPLKILKTINLSHSLNLVSTSNFKSMPHLEFLLLEGCIKLSEVDPGIGELERLTVLYLKDCNNLVSLPSSVGRLKSLKYLILSGCSKLQKLPDELGHVSCLEVLDLSRTGMTEVPSPIVHLENLKKFSLAGCNLHPSSTLWNVFYQFWRRRNQSNHIPVGLSLSRLSVLHSLTELNVSECNLSELPSEFGCLSTLRRLDLSRNKFIRLPDSIGQLSRLESLQLHWCRNLRALPELPSLASVDASHCISLDTLANQIGQCNSVLFGSFVNCFKLVENESTGSIAVALLTRYLKSKAFSDHNNRFNCIVPGNEIPEWYNHQSVGDSITVELQPGWLSNKWMGFAWCVVFRFLVPQPPWTAMFFSCRLVANGKLMPFNFQFFGREWGAREWGEFYAIKPVSDQIWLSNLHRDFCKHEWQDIYYRLDFSIQINYIEKSEDRRIYTKVVEVKKCGVRMVYEEDAEEPSTKRRLQHYDDDDDDDDDDDASSSSASQAHPRSMKQLHLDGAGPSGAPYS
ncbi:putative toll-like receptor, P-loop containing nucleoside triphosphate hydrolase [Rosa chinensis]|uniref:ADP-ribosyl cyclase/cyclic ADP-ribose hydrolase n=1 Tax=Rosa chinensis TaxID=74649 RepID=A0A2P6PJJ4_ROSCH|nr:disease resistance protein RUN1 [Rosa chinensis]XP_024162734.1 disease resistance protein RUN1 [Rosa chinensis]XP_024162735.1 disease resistance protein RUN1 [Rosa chinensis]XP_024162736.1 disease resistance protein RUN1 [Rosa chinensis]PRQ22084.1 putative toll-like receptor, P-loop containing nucleoside triphosphate hydrolase [Rosa chinensis]